MKSTLSKAFDKFFRSIGSRQAKPVVITRMYQTTMTDLKRLIAERGPVAVHKVELNSMSFLHIELTTDDACLLRQRGFYLREV